MGLELRNFSPFRPFLMASGGNPLAADRVFFRDYLVDGLGASPTYTRASSATVPDHEGIVRSCLTNEIRYPGWRRVRNLFTSSTATLASGSATTAVTIGVGTYTFAMGAGSGRATFSGTATGSTGTLDAHATNRTAKVLTITVGGTIIVTASLAALTDISLTNTSNQSNTAPPEYVSVGVLSAPYHGFGADGVKYFRTTNANTVDANGVVTEARGTDIIGIKGVLLEPSATNLVQSSNDLTGWYTNTAPSDAARVLTNVVAPNGYYATRLVPSTGNASHTAYYLLSGGPTTGSICYSALIHKSTWTNNYYVLSFTGSSFSTSTYVYFNLVTGAVAKTEGNTVVAGIESRPGGWWYIWASTTVLDNTLQVIGFLPCNEGMTSFNFPSDGVSGPLVAAVQAEAGERPTSTINTSGTAVTRAADSAISYPLTTPQDEGMAIIECQFPFGSPTTSEKGMLSLRSASAQSLLYGPAGSAVLRGTDGINNADTGSAFSVTGACTMAIRWNAATGKMQTSILKSGTWTTSGEATYDGSFITNDVLRVASAAAYPMVVKSVSLYNKDKGQAWIRGHFL